MWEVICFTEFTDTSLNYGSVLFNLLARNVMYSEYAHTAVVVSPALVSKPPTNAGWYFGEWFPCE